MYILLILLIQCWQIFIDKIQVLNPWGRRWGSLPKTDFQVQNQIYHFLLPEELLHSQLNPINDISVVSCQQCFQGEGTALWGNFVRSAVEDTYQAWRHL